MTRVLYPPTIRYGAAFEGVGIFLAGPIKGAPDWQAEAIGRLSECRRRVEIYNPRFPGKWHGDFVAQVKWETAYLRRAQIHLFWLAKEAEHFPDRAYAQTSRFELGEWFQYHSTKENYRELVVGIEPGFTGEKYIRQRMEYLSPVFSTLEDTCNRAIEVIETLDPPFYKQFDK